MWYADKAAFRTGQVLGFNWNKDSIGNYSFATGLDTKAKGVAATALGYNTSATGYYSLTSGYYTTTQGLGTVAGGYNTLARGDFFSATGDSTIAGSYGEVVIGAYNTLYNGNPFTWMATDRVFSIGNGATGARSDAFTVLKNGNVGIGTNTPAQKLDVAGTVSATAYTGNGSTLSNVVNTTTAQTIGGTKTFTSGKIRMMGTSDTIASWGSLTLRANDDALGNENLAFMVGNTERARIDYNGNMCIGTILATAQLHTTGSVRMEGLTSGFLQAHASGNLSTSAAAPPLSRTRQGSTRQVASKYPAMDISVAALIMAASFISVPMTTRQP